MHFLFEDGFFSISIWQVDNISTFMTFREMLSDVVILSGRILNNSLSALESSLS